MLRKNYAINGMRTLLTQPVYRLLVLCFIVVSLIPIGMLSVKMYHDAWGNAWREINEKHRLLALNLASPIQIYVRDHAALLSLLASRSQDLIDSDPALAQVDLDKNLKHLRGFRSLSLINLDGSTLALSQHIDTPTGITQLFATEGCFIISRDTAKPALSGIKLSPLTGEPTLILSQPVFGDDDELLGVLMGELGVELIDELRSKIKFGEKGHSAIVDENGHVIAHPNREWMKEMRDLSHLSIVKAMMAGKTGVMEFYSPFVKQNMVAGYTSVPEIGWGIMVPQPITEVETQVNALLSSHLRWGLLGLILAAALAVFLILWITRPINRLAEAALSLSDNEFKGELPKVQADAPREITQLNEALRVLVNGLQNSHTVIDELNSSLQTRIDGATKQLREANDKLESLAQRDHLTGLSNRRHFEEGLLQILNNAPKTNQYLCLMLIDFDNFKQINDRYGHAAGDAVLSHIADLLKQTTDEKDLSARYGGDEFVAQMFCDPKEGRRRAQDILDSVSQNAVEWENQNIKMTVSIGMLHWQHTGKLSMGLLLQKVDKAMYKAKAQGRNQFVEVLGLTAR